MYMATIVFHFFSSTFSSDIDHESPSIWSDDIIRALGKKSLLTNLSYRTSLTNEQK